MKTFRSENPIIQNKNSLKPGGNFSVKRIAALSIKLKEVRIIQRIGSAGTNPS